MDIKSCRSSSVMDHFQTKVGDNLAEVIQHTPFRGIVFLYMVMEQSSKKLHVHQRLIFVQVPNHP